MVYKHIRSLAPGLGSELIKQIKLLKADNHTFVI